jgi:hypothetical protein
MLKVNRCVGRFYHMLTGEAAAEARLQEAQARLDATSAELTRLRESLRGDVGAKVGDGLVKR